MKRICNTSNETLKTVLANCKEDLEIRDTIDLFYVRLLLEKALDGVEERKDLCYSNVEDIKKIRELIKGL